MSFRRLLLALLATGCLVGLSPPTQANTMPSMSFDEKAAAADTVVLAVMGERLREPAGQPKTGDRCPGDDQVDDGEDGENVCIVVTPSRYAVETVHVLKGEAPKHFVLAVLPIREHAPMCCIKGHRYLLFLRRGTETFTPVESWEAVFDLESKERN